MQAEGKSRIAVVEIKFVRQAEKYTQTAYTRNRDIEELKTESVLTKTLAY
jgi:hypothetical protein